MGTLHIIYMTLVASITKFKYPDYQNIDGWLAWRYPPILDSPACHFGLAYIQRHSLLMQIREHEMNLPPWYTDIAAPATD
jgi:hypothetical protein